jgi:hypothetical protein
MAGVTKMLGIMLGTLASAERTPRKTPPMCGGPSLWFNATRFDGVPAFINTTAKTPALCCDRVRDNTSPPTPWCTTLTPLHGALSTGMQCSLATSGLSGLTLLHGTVHCPLHVVSLLTSPHLVDSAPPTPSVSRGTRSFHRRIVFCGVQCRVGLQPVPLLPSKSASVGIDTHLHRRHRPQHRRQPRHPHPRPKTR